ncbi:peptide chain release factor N(5)-glutamine methyltransferase [Paracoccus methylarcula]|uniref:Release factor glutamine methyltransferase n=1 Tax=Paracoccus methylarcula TaxID=72022 RepID=A0A422QTK6_9RHOB|nr:peptide chain release factor N(5)-glutamine methyltransferase [Paracoccus methylarcula]RNF33132.1 peptide chain release factor N(5)-glutamine methyltransferase [Paracoccus methylarcula]
MSRPTGKELCLAAQERLEAAGIEDGHRDASLLFMHALNKVLGVAVKRHHLAQHLKAEVSPALEAAFMRAIDARAARQPVSQITGRRAFWKHEFRVTRDTLDPRPETETLVEAALELPWRSVLDMGTGTGAILISLLAERPGCTGTGTDISAAALDVARGNAQVIGVTARLIAADWYEGVTGRFDLIVSNPPYIALDEMAELAPEVREWEPNRALTDGADGLTAYRAIAAGAANHLAPGGHVLVEIGPTQGAAVAAIFRRQGAETRLIPDLDGRDRVVLAHFGS